MSDPAVAVYDHANSTLNAYAKDFAGNIEKAVGVEAELSVATRLAKSRSKILLVHIRNKGWEVLLDKCRGDQVIVRFSTDEPEPSQLESTAGGALALRLRLKMAEFNFAPKGDIRLLIDELSLPDNVDQLRSGFVPRTLQRFFQFVVPQYSRAIFLLCIGYIAMRIGDKLDTQDLSDQRILKEAKNVRLQDLPSKYFLQNSEHLKIKANWQSVLGINDKDFKTKIAREFGERGQLDKKVQVFLEELCDPSDTGKSFEVAVLDILDYVSKRL